jgi:hypothetical protein
MNSKLPFDDLEKIYDIVATAIDEVGEERESLFLAKLVMILADQSDDIDTVRDAITVARADLDQTG